MARDRYDLEHEETGSGNISKASPEWMMVLRQAREDIEGVEPLEGDFVLHRAYAIVNQRAQAGEPWAKCMDCGSPFIVGQGAGSSPEFCSTSCGKAYTDEFSKGL